MEDGRIVHEGKKAEFFNNYEDDRIRKFIAL